LRTTATDDRRPLLEAVVVRSHSVWSISVHATTTFLRAKVEEVRSLGYEGIRRRYFDERAITSENDPGGPVYEVTIDVSEVRPGVVGVVVTVEDVTAGYGPAWEHLTLSRDD